MRIFLSGNTCKSHATLSTINSPLSTINYSLGLVATSVFRYYVWNYFLLSDFVIFRSFFSNGMITKEVVLTGLGVLSPVGLDKESFGQALLEAQSGIGFLNIQTSNHALRPMGSEVPDFHAKDFVKPRKNIKVMSRDIQLAFVSACHASTDAGLVTEGNSRTVDPERLGVIFGSDLIGAEVDMLLDAFRSGIHNGQYNFDQWGTDAMNEVFPLWMLKFLPNMPACQISIGHDARGPSNSITLCRGSSLAAIIEAVRTIKRGAADVMIAGGCGNRINQDFQTRIKSYFVAPRQQDPNRVPRPFDIDRCGSILGEGSGAFVLERREFAEARGAKIYATIRGFAEVNEPNLHKTRPTGNAIRNSIRFALQRASLTPNDIGFVNADGIGTEYDDRIEAEAIQDVLGNVPVTSNKGNFGDLGSGTGAVELVSTILSLQDGRIPPTRNHEKTAPDCPINVVHGKPATFSSSFVLKLNQTRMGRSFALILEK
ncbi:MAG: beta-ketoacyl-[acyl-carrier-protein] synthase family protein [Planctomycetaceae bacterium]|jgi:3-oxoacyl-[acyl-carrier-protein] synthase II|nr:beta-ketoacyl-[acyl-carrier-protein] synthase family protein [Planctomycetaceae bacterium]